MEPSEWEAKLLKDVTTGLNVSGCICICVTKACSLQCLTYIRKLTVFKRLGEARTCKLEYDRSVLVDFQNLKTEIFGLGFESRFRIVQRFKSTNKMLNILLQGSSNKF